jgi:hypothetical protein
MSAIAKAASRLQRSLNIPSGGANTIAYSGVSEPYIRVLLDPSYVAWKRSIPRAFDGFKVVVDLRDRAVANRRH